MRARDRETKRKSERELPNAKHVRVTAEQISAVCWYSLCE